MVGLRWGGCTAWRDFGIVFLLARLARTRTFASFVAPVALCVVLMIALTVASQVGVSRGWRCFACRWIDPGYGGG